MRYVILRDDDTNALTPAECLEQLYRPFLDRNLPVNLAAIPRVRTDTVTQQGVTEGYLFAKRNGTPPTVPFGNNADLVRYLHDNSGYHLLQHGYHHTLFEFGSTVPADVDHRLTQGTQTLKAAGFQPPQTFVAPYDRFSRVSLEKAARQFRVISTGWFELRRLPFAWWPQYALKKMLKRKHWRVGRTLLLTHPGCLLSYRRSYATMLESVKHAVQSQAITVLVTHWWEYFRDGKPDEKFIGVLHQTAEFLSTQPDVRVISFDDLASGKVALN
jgi:predicted deacetylase